MDKKTIRTIIRERKATVNAIEHGQWSAAICQKLLNHAKVTKAETVLLFYPLSDEPDIRPVIEALHNAGKRVLLPVVTGPESMVLRCYNGEDMMENGSLGTLHPQGEEYTEIASIDVAIIPGVAFDRQGNRMGRGKGYYDRFLSSVEASAQVYLIGICFPFQILESIPTDDYDIPMDEVVTA